MQHMKRAKGVPPPHRAQSVRRAAEVGHHAPVGGRTLAHAAGEHVLHAKGVHQGFRAAHLVDVAMGQKQLRQLIHALGAQERLCDERHRVAPAAIHQQIRPPPGQITKHSTPLRQRQGGERDRSPMNQRRHTAQHRQRAQRCHGPRPAPGGKKPTGHDAHQ